MTEATTTANTDAPASRSSRDKLLASALACFDEHGLTGMTIEQIRRQANSSIGSLYHHFGNREGLIAALFLQLLDDRETEPPWKEGTFNGPHRGRRWGVGTKLGCGGRSAQTPVAPHTV